MAREIHYEEVKGYYDNDQLCEHYWVNIEQDEYNGPFRRWFKDGTRQADCYFERGRLVGISRWWFPNGQLQMVSENVGNDCGFFAEYDREGNLVEADYTTDEETIDLTGEVKGMTSEELTDEYVMLLRLKHYE